MSSEPLTKQEVAEDIMRVVRGRSDLGAQAVADALAKRLSMANLQMMLHVVMNPGEIEQ